LGYGGRRRQGPNVGYDHAALIQAICRQYAAAQKAMPYDTMYAQCMYARATECRVPRRRPTLGFRGTAPSAEWNGVWSLAEK
jgi:hypothetical protein